jgi:hypothetical protein
MPATRPIGDGTTVSFTHDPNFKADRLTTRSADLPGHFAVWAASEQAEFLHGRFVWSAWDVDELATGEIRQRIADDPNYLKVGVIGL